MAIKKNKEVIELIKALEGVMKEIADLDDSYSNIVECFYEDMRDYILYLSCADGFISKEESEFIECYLGYYLTPNEMVNQIRRANINCVRYSHGITDFIKKIIVLEAKIYKKLKKTYGLCIRYILQIYLMLGKELANCADQNEMKVLLYACQYVQNACDIINSILPEEIEIFETDKSLFDDSNGCIAPLRDYEKDEDTIEDDIENDIEINDTPDETTEINTEIDGDDDWVSVKAPKKSIGHGVTIIKAPKKG